MRLVDADDLLEKRYDADYWSDCQDPDWVVAWEDIENAPTIEPYGTWIPCSEQLPEEKINPITQDYFEYPVTAEFGNIRDVRYYKFGDGHWWHFAQIMDEHVIAWLPAPKPYEKTN